MTIPNFANPPLQLKGDSGIKMIGRKMIQDVAREIPIYSDPVYRPLLNMLKHLSPKFIEAYWTLTQKWIWILKTILHFKKVLLQKHTKDQISHISKNLKNWKVWLIQAGLSINSYQNRVILTNYKKWYREKY